MTPRTLAWSIIAIWACAIPLVLQGWLWSASACLLGGGIGLGAWMLVDILSAAARPAHA